MKKLVIMGIIILVTLTSVSCGKDNYTSKNDEASVESTENNDGEKSLKSDNTVTNNKDNSISINGKKSIYKDKLDKIKDSLKDLDDLYKGNTIEMKAATEEEYSRWDKALNEIYNELKNDLSKSDMSNLEKEEVKWIKHKEEKAKSAAAEFKGGTAENLAYTQSLAETTKERCYELVEKYMK